MSEWVFYGLWTLTAVGFAGVYWIIGAQENVAHDLVVELQRVEQAVVDDQWQAASHAITEVYDTWKRIEKLWALHTQHEQLEAVGEALLEAEALIHLQDAHAVAALRLAGDRLQTLPQRDRLLWSNLL